MKPRLPTSSKWTAIPSELRDQIRDIFSENFADPAQKGKFVVEGRIYSSELMLRVGYIENGRLKQSNIEVSLDFDPNKQNALAQIYLAVDCAASLMHEYFEIEQNLSDFPKVWSDFEAGEAKAYVQVSTVNTTLEDEANRLLGEADIEDPLVKDNDQSDKASPARPSKAKPKKNVH